MWPSTLFPLLNQDIGAWCSIVQNELGAVIVRSTPAWQACSEPLDCPAHVNPTGLAGPLVNHRHKHPT